MTEGPTYEVQVYESNSEWRWRLIAENGQIVGTSHDAYVRKDHAEKMAHQIFGGTPNVEITA